MAQETQVRYAVRSKHPPCPLWLTWFSNFTHPHNSAITRSGQNSVVSGQALNSPLPSSRHRFRRSGRTFSSAFSVLKNAIADRSFPPPRSQSRKANSLVALNPSATLPLRSGFAARVTPATLFDLASVTKVVATTTMAMILYERGLLELEAPVIGVVPEFLADSCGEPDSRRRDVTFRMLLAHSSGLPAYEKLFLQAALARRPAARRLHHFPFHRSRHARRIQRHRIHHFGRRPRTHRRRIARRFCQREIFGPLGMVNTAFNPPKESRAKIPPTADERSEANLARRPARASQKKSGRKQTARSTFRQRIIQGEVQDENASVLGGVAGHAGLSPPPKIWPSSPTPCSMADAPSFAPKPSRSSPAANPRRRHLPRPGLGHALFPFAIRKIFRPRSFGHLGYTGTSLWIDPDRQLSITLLTNRTWPDCANQAIKQVRPKFHDAVVEALQPINVMPDRTTHSAPYDVQPRHCRGSTCQVIRMICSRRYPERRTT